MEFTTLGRTGLRVSVMGLGCGGLSRLGTRKGNTAAEAEAVVHAALDLGINFIDTAESYGTEEIVGRALVGTPRAAVVLSSKAGVDWEGGRSTPEEYRDRIHACLKRLRIDHIDIFHVHGVTVDEYAYAAEVLMPAMRELQREGKVRFIGITEAFSPDPGHRMLSAAEPDDYWDVMMVGFNLLNQSARDRVFRWTRARGIGTLGMFAVRRALTDPALVASVIRELIDRGEVDADALDRSDPLGFLLADGIASSLSDAAYRFCRYESGVDVILSGTGNFEHLRENASSLNKPPLPEAVAACLRKVFGAVDSVAGN